MVGRKYVRRLKQTPVSTPLSRSLVSPQKFIWFCELMLSNSCSSNIIGNDFSSLSILNEVLYRDFCCVTSFNLMTEEVAEDNGTNIHLIRNWALTTLLAVIILNQQTILFTFDDESALGVFDKNVLGKIYGPLRMDDGDIDIVQRIMSSERMRALQLCKYST